MVRIRLTKIGRKNAPAYRIVAVDRKAKRDGKYIESLGHYNPTENPDKIEYKKDRFDFWISQGAQASDAVKKLISGKYVFKKYDPKAEAEAKLKEEQAAAEAEAEAKAAETPAASENNEAETPEAVNEDKPDTAEKADTDSEKEKSE